MATLPPALTWWWWYWCWHVHYVKLMRVFLRPMQLMINTSSCKYYCVRSCMYVRAQVCDTLPHMATVGRDSHGASHVCLPHHPAFSGHQITLLTHCTACMVLFFIVGQSRRNIWVSWSKKKTQLILKLFVAILVAKLCQKTKIAEKKLHNNHKLYILCTDGCQVRF